MVDVYEVIFGNLFYNLGDCFYGYKLGIMEFVLLLVIEMLKISEDGIIYIIFIC